MNKKTKRQKKQKDRKVFFSLNLKEVLTTHYNNMSPNTDLTLESSEELSWYPDQNSDRSGMEQRLADLDKINKTLVDVFHSRKKLLFENTKELYMGEFYEETLCGAKGGTDMGGVGLQQWETIEWLAWMTHSDEEKKQLLDDDLKNYMKG